MSCGNQIYSMDTTEEVLLNDGRKVTIRPIRPDDAPRLQQGFLKLSKESIYMRFLQAASCLTDEQANHLSSVDYHNRMALVGIVEENGEQQIVSVARYAILDRDPPGGAEAAIVVRDDYQRLGLGKISMDRLAHYAKSHGVQYFSATVHTSNIRLIKFIQSSGLRFQKEIIEPGVWEIRIFLDE